MAKDYVALQNRICYPPDPNPKKPKVAPPAGACDTHVHLFGPPHLYPFQAKRVYTPPAARCSIILLLSKLQELSVPCLLHQMRTELTIVLSMMR